jgi:hypothetical protein
MGADLRAFDTPSYGAPQTSATAEPPYRRRFGARPHASLALLLRDSRQISHARRAKCRRNLIPVPNCDAPQPVPRPEAWRALRARFRAPPPLAPAAPTEDRVVWFDYAKGICITLVVMMHSTLGVGDAMGGEGFMHGVGFLSAIGPVPLPRHRTRLAYLP